MFNLNTGIRFVVDIGAAIMILSTVKFNAHVNVYPSCGTDMIRNISGIKM